LKIQAKNLTKAYKTMALVTSYWRPGEDYVKQILNAVRDKVQNGDIVTVSEKAISTASGNLIDESIKVVPGHPFKHFKGWRADGQWKDDIPERFGEGPFAAALFYSPARDAEFMVFWWAQGRGVGRGRGDVPQPEKDAALMRELEEIVNTIRPFRKA